MFAIALALTLVLYKITIDIFAFKSDCIFSEIFNL